MDDTRREPARTFAGRLLEVDGAELASAEGAALLAWAIEANCEVHGATPVVLHLGDARLAAIEVAPSTEPPDGIEIVHAPKGSYRRLPVIAETDARSQITGVADHRTGAPAIEHDGELLVPLRTTDRT